MYNPNSRSGKDTPPPSPHKSGPQAMELGSPEKGASDRDEENREVQASAQRSPTKSPLYKQTRVGRSPLQEVPQNNVEGRSASSSSASAQSYWVQQQSALQAALSAAPPPSHSALPRDPGIKRAHSRLNSPEKVAPAGLSADAAINPVMAASSVAAKKSLFPDFVWASSLLPPAAPIVVAAVQQIVQPASVSAVVHPVPQQQAAPVVPAAVQVAAPIVPVAVQALPAAADGRKCRADFAAIIQQRPDNWYAILQSRVTVLGTMVGDVSSPFVAKPYPEMTSNERAGTLNAKIIQGLVEHENGQLYAVRLLTLAQLTERRISPVTPIRDQQSVNHLCEKHIVQADRPKYLIAIVVDGLQNHNQHVVNVGECLKNTAGFPDFILVTAAGEKSAVYTADQALAAAKVAHDQKRQNFFQPHGAAPVPVLFAPPVLTAAQQRAQFKQSIDALRAKMQRLTDDYIGTVRNAVLQLRDYLLNCCNNNQVRLRNTDLAPIQTQLTNIIRHHRTNADRVMVFRSTELRNLEQKYKVGDEKDLVVEFAATVEDFSTHMRKMIQDYAKYNAKFDAIFTAHPIATPLLKCVQDEVDYMQQLQPAAPQHVIQIY